MTPIGRPPVAAGFKPPSCVTSARPSRVAIVIPNVAKRSEESKALVIQDCSRRRTGLTTTAQHPLSLPTVGTTRGFIRAVSFNEMTPIGRPPVAAGFKPPSCVTSARPSRVAIVIPNVAKRSEESKALVIQDCSRRRTGLTTTAQHPLSLPYGRNDARLHSCCVK